MEGEAGRTLGGGVPLLVLGRAEGAAGGAGATGAAGASAAAVTGATEPPSAPGAGVARGRCLGKREALPVRVAVGAREGEVHGVWRVLRVRAWRVCRLYVRQPGPFSARYPAGVAPAC